MIEVERSIYSASGSAEPPVSSQKIRSFCFLHRSPASVPLSRVGLSGSFPSFPASCSQDWKAVWWERIRSTATCLRRVLIQDLRFPSKEQPVCLACTRTNCTSQDTICTPFCEVDLPFMRVDHVHRRTVTVFDVSQDWENLKCWMLSGLVVSQKASYHP